jgi:hypothetical protein
MDNFDLRKYLVENKVTTNSKMMNEESALNFEKEAHQFPELVAKYGIQAVADALEAIYINAEDASEGAGVDANTLYLNQVDSFKEDPSSLVATVEDSL